MDISETMSLKRTPGGPPSSAGHGPVGNPRPVNGRAIKVTIVLDAADVAMLRALDGQRRTTLHIKAGGRDVSVDIATKSLRKAIATIVENGPDQCAAIVQGKLERGDIVSDGGLTVQLRTPKAGSETPG